MKGSLTACTVPSVLPIRALYPYSPTTKFTVTISLLLTVAITRVIKPFIILSYTVYIYIYISFISSRDIRRWSVTSSGYGTTPYSSYSVCSSCFIMDEYEFYLHVE